MKNEQMKIILHEIFWLNTTDLSNPYVKLDAWSLIIIQKLNLFCSNNPQVGILKLSISQQLLKNLVEKSGNMIITIGYTTTKTSQLNIVSFSSWTV